MKTSLKTILLGFVIACALTACGTGATGENGAGVAGGPTSRPAVVAAP